jgi:DNA-binding transcriptional LysR family regulator
MRGLEPDLRNVRAFLAVVDEGSFTGAGRRLHLSQQGLTDRIHRLEQQLGARLLTRTTRRVELSPIGAELVDEARSLVREADERWARIVARAARPPGRLTIGVSASLVFGVLPRLVEAFAEHADQLGDTELDARELPMDELIARVSDGTLDAAVALAPPETPDLGMDVVHVGTVDLMIAESHPLARARVASLGDLAGTPILLTPRETSPGMHDAVVGACRAAGFDPEVVALPRERGYLPRTVFDGRAFTVWSTLSPPEYVRKGLVTVPLREPRPRLETRLLFRPGTDGPGLDLLRDVLRRCIVELEAAQAQARQRR